MQINRRRFLASVSGTIPIVMAGCSGGGVETRVSTVQVEDGHFSKCNVLIKKGGRVVWENKTDTAHTITSASDNWEFEAKLEADTATQKKFDRSDVYVATVSKDGSSTKRKMKISVGDAKIKDKIDSC